MIIPVFRNNGCIFHGRNLRHTAKSPMRSQHLAERANQLRSPRANWKVSRAKKGCGGQGAERRAGDETQITAKLGNIKFRRARRRQRRRRSGAVPNFIRAVAATSDDEYLRCNIGFTRAYPRRETCALNKKGCHFVRSLSLGPVPAFALYSPPQCLSTFFSRLNSLPRALWPYASVTLRVSVPRGWCSSWNMAERRSCLWGTRFFV